MRDLARLLEILDRDRKADGRRWQPIVGASSLGDGRVEIGELFQENGQTLVHWHGTLTLADGTFHPALSANYGEVITTTTAIREWWSLP